jgi:hypothetical protein
MVRDRQRKNIEQCGRRIEPAKARGRKPGWRGGRLSIVKKGDALADMGEWVIDDAD